jgi:hypothetical protein
MSDYNIRLCLLLFQVFYLNLAVVEFFVKRKK